MRLIALMLLLPTVAIADTWPQWRGATRDGISVGNPWPDTLDDTTFTPIWQVKDLGESYSAPVVGKDRVYTTETVNKKTERVRCLDRATGKEIWKKEWEGSLTVPFFAARNGSWIRATPTLDGDDLFVAGIRDVLYCLDARDGKERWKFDFVAELKSPLPAFGFVCSPLVDEKSVYVQAGTALVKLDRKTGKILWQALKEGDAMLGSAFSSPVFATLGGREQVVVQTRTRLAGVDRDKGDVIWEKEIPSFRGMNILTPVIAADGVFTSTYQGNTRLVGITAAGDPKNPADAWTLKYEGHMTTPVVVDGHAYLFGRDRRCICIEVKTGKEKWRTEERFGEYWSMVARGDKILALDNVGKLYLLKANPEKYEPLGDRVVSKAETWAHLAVAGDEVFVRDLFGLSAYKFTAKK